MAILLFIVALALFGILIWAKQSASNYYFRDPARVDSSRVASSRIYDRVMDEEFSNRPDFEGVLDSITVQTNEPDILIEMPTRRELDEYVDNTLFEYHRIPFGGVLVSEEGKVWLDHLAVAYGEFPLDKTNEYSVPLPARFFDGRLRELSEEEIAEIAPYDWERNLSFEGMFPKVKFVLKGELTEAVKVLGFDVFDARTHESLSGGYSWGGDLEEGHKVEMDLQLWHAAPIELVADVAFGPPQIIEFPARTGARVAYPEGELMLVVVAEDMDQRSTSSDNKKVTVRVQPKTYNRDEKTTCFVLACLPKAFRTPLDVELLDANGAVLQNRGGGTSGLFLEKSVVGNAASVSTVRVKYYPNRKRLIFHLPEIPGLPESNDKVENLFDVRIPYVNIRQNYEFRELVSNLTQMQIKGSWPSSPNLNTGPLRFENVTVRELVDEYAKLYGPSFAPRIDQENLTIEFIDQSLRARFERLLDWFKKKGVHFR